jgi:saccharopine dehydrogenase (NAD+, L-lysine-forming)
VFNIEQFDPDPFMDMLGTQGLPWTVEELPGPVEF